MQKVEEKVFLFEYKQGLRFIPAICPTCPNFKGNSTCLLHLSTVYKDEETMHVHGISALDVKYPYERMKTCKLQEQHANVAYHDQRKKKAAPPSPNQLTKEQLIKACNVEIYARSYGGRVPDYQLIAFSQSKNYQGILIDLKTNEYMLMKESTKKDEKYKPVYTHLSRADAVNEIKDPDYLVVKTDTSDLIADQIHLLLPKFTKETYKTYQHIIEDHVQRLSQNTETKDFEMVGVSLTDIKKIVCVHEGQYHTCFMFDEITVKSPQRIRKYLDYYTFFKWCEDGAWTGIV